MYIIPTFLGFGKWSQIYTFHAMPGAYTAKMNNVRRGGGRAKQTVCFRQTQRDSNEKNELFLEHVLFFTYTSVFNKQIKLINRRYYYVCIVAELFKPRRFERFSLSRPRR